MASYDSKEKFALAIHKMPDGGFVVIDAPMFPGGESRFCFGPLFAATDIGEALAYVRKQLAPPEK